MSEPIQELSQEKIAQIRKYLHRIYCDYLNNPMLAQSNAYCRDILKEYDQLQGFVAWSTIANHHGHRATGIYIHDGLRTIVHSPIFDTPIDVLRMKPVTDDMLKPCYVHMVQMLPNKLRRKLLALQDFNSLSIVVDMLANVGHRRDPAFDIEHITMFEALIRTSITQYQPQTLLGASNGKS